MNKCHEALAMHYISHWPGTVLHRLSINNYFKQNFFWCIVIQSAEFAQIWGNLCPQIWYILTSSDYTNFSFPLYNSPVVR